MEIQTRAKRNRGIPLPSPCRQTSHFPHPSLRGSHAPHEFPGTSRMQFQNRFSRRNDRRRAPPTKSQTSARRSGRPHCSAAGRRNHRRVPPRDHPRQTHHASRLLRGQELRTSRLRRLGHRMAPSHRCPPGSQRSHLLIRRFPTGTNRPDRTFFCSVEKSWNSNLSKANVQVGADRRASLVARLRPVFNTTT